MIERIRACVADEFDQVDRLIVEQLHSDVDMVENIGHYIIEAGGKRMRPLLALLSAAILGDCTPNHIKFAAIVEFIHTATLLHDDVVDVSSLRRGRPTANDKFGNAPSVLVGDFLYTRAFQLMVQLQSLPVLEHMANTTNTIAEGEVLQLVRAGDPNVTEAQYLDVITRKTAVLFSAACKGAGMLSLASEAQIEALDAFGLHLGIGFQMMDDVLDYEGDPAVTGKNVGDDLDEGKPTLPLIRAMEVGSEYDAKLIREALRNKSSDKISDVMAAVTRCGGTEYTRQQAQKHIDLARDALTIFEDIPAKEALNLVADLAINRDK